MNERGGGRWRKEDDKGRRRIEKEKVEVKGGREKYRLVGWGFRG